MGIMDIPQTRFAPWTRKHDKPGIPHIPQAQVIFFPRSLEDLITICKERPANNRVHAAGSHWALSDSAISDALFIETHDFNNIFPAMGRTLFEVVGAAPGCLAEEFLIDLNKRSSGAKRAPEYLVHFESGKRIYQLYAELDVGDSKNPDSLSALMKKRFNNDLFEGSWAFHTLGGAGGQTVVGALSTGTHGGDFDRPPVADSLRALHLVADGGKHFWIERNRTRFTDEAKLRAHYGQDKFGGQSNFDVKYVDAVWATAIVQVGRFGVVYSAVLEVEPQYGLRQTITQDVWEKVRDKIANQKFHPDQFLALFNEKFFDIPQRFLQIAINPVPMANGTEHTCGITKRWTLLDLGQVEKSHLRPVTWNPDGGNVAGRPERVGDSDFISILG